MDPQTVIILVSVLLVAMVIHELAHAWAAYKLGDNTAKDLGRLTINPIPHIDPFMSILVPGMLIWNGLPAIGGAKPVPYNPRNFQDPKKGTVIVAAAGPISNFILTFVFGLLFFVSLKLGIGTDPKTVSSSVEFFQRFCLTSVFINLLLAFFNLIPILPLDGGRILFGLLPDNLSRQYAKIEKFGLLIVVALFMSGMINPYLNFVFLWILQFLPDAFGPYLHLIFG